MMKSLLAEVGYAYGMLTQLSYSFSTQNPDRGGVQIEGGGKIKYWLNIGQAMDGWSSLQLTGVSHRQISSLSSCRSSLCQQCRTCTSEVV